MFQRYCVDILTKKATCQCKYWPAALEELLSIHVREDSTWWAMERGPAWRRAHGVEHCLPANVSSESYSQLVLIKEHPSSHQLRTLVKMLPIILVWQLLKVCVMAQVVSHCRLTIKTLIQSQTSSCGICGGQNCIGTGVSISTLVFPCQYHSTSAPYSFIHLPPTLYNCFFPVLQFSLSISFHQCSILIHTSTTNAV
jgi:hypothetical protein